MQVVEISIVDTRKRKEKRNEKRKEKGKKKMEEARTHRRLHALGPMHAFARAQWRPYAQS